MSHDVVVAQGSSSLIRRVAGGAGWSLAGRLIVVGLGLVIGIVLTRLLPAEQMGIYLLVSSIVAFGALVAGAGISQLCTRYVAQYLAVGQADRVRPALRVLLRLGVGCAAATAVIAVAVTGSFGQNVYRGPGLFLLSVLLGAWVFGVAAQAFFADSLRGLSEIRAASLYGGPVTSALIMSGLLAVLAFDRGITVNDVLMLVVAATAAGTACAALSLRLRLRRLPRGPSGNGSQMSIRGVFAVSVPLAFTNGLLFTLSSADLWVLGAVRSTADVAVYGVASRSATLVAMPLLVVFGVLPPVIAGLNASGDLIRLERVLRMTATAASAPAALLTLTFVVAGGPLLALIYGEHYRAGASLLVILSIGQLIAVLTGVCGLVLVMTGHQRLLLLVTAATVVATVVMLVVAVPLWGMVGAAVVSTVGLSVQNIALLTVARRTTGLLTFAAPPWSMRSLRQVLP